MTAAPTDLLVRDVLEAEARKVMALRVSLPSNRSAKAKSFSVVTLRFSSSPRTASTASPANPAMATSSVASAPA